MAFEKETYLAIKDDWNEGERVEVIATMYARHPAEVIVAIIDMALRGYKVRPLHKLF